MENVYRKKVEEKKLLGRHGRRREANIKLILQNGSPTIFIATGHPHVLLWAVSRAARGKITTGGILVPNCIN
jgi:hypothetical protein